MKPLSSLLRFISLLMALLWPLSAQSGDEAAPIKVVYFQDYPPFSQGVGEQVHGVFIDILQEALAKRMKQPIIHGGSPWERAQYMVKQGEADAFVTVHNLDRQRYTEASSEALYSDAIHFYVRKTHPDFNKIKDFTRLEQYLPYKIGSYIGAGWTKTNLSGFNVTYFRLSESLYRSAAQGIVDVSPEIAAQARPLIVKLGLKDEIVEVPHSFDTLHYRLCIRKGSNFAKLLPEFDKTLKAMRSDGSLAAILKKHDL